MLTSDWAQRFPFLITLQHLLLFSDEQCFRFLLSYHPDVMFLCCQAQTILAFHIKQMLLRQFLHTHYLKMLNSIPHNLLHLLQELISACIGCGPPFPPETPVNTDRSNVFPNHSANLHRLFLCHAIQKELLFLHEHVTLSYEPHRSHGCQSLLLTSDNPCQSVSADVL